MSEIVRSGIMWCGASWVYIQSFRLNKKYSSADSPTINPAEVYNPQGWLKPG